MAIRDVTRMPVRGATTSDPAVLPIRQNRPGSTLSSPAQIPAIAPATSEEWMARMQARYLRWNVAQYVISAPEVVNGAVAVGGSITLGLFQNSQGNNLGGSLLASAIAVVFAGRIASNVNDCDVVMEVDGHEWTMQLAQVFATGPVVYPAAPDIYFTRWDPVVNLYVFRHTPGDVRGFFWERRAQFSLRNTGTSAFTVTRSQIFSKEFIE